MIFNQFSFFLLILAICSQIFYEIQSKNDKNFIYGVRFNSIGCNADNKTFVVKYCYLKPVSRKIVTFNFGVKVLVPLTKPYYGHSVIYYRYGTIFRQIIDTKKFEICAILDGGDINPLIKLIVEMIKSRDPTLLHKCPFIGDWDMMNFTMNTDIIDRASMLFPHGIYRGDLSIYINDSNALNVSVVCEIKSSIKETFG